MRSDVVAFRDGWFNVQTCQWFPADAAERGEACTVAGVECPAEAPLTMHYFDVRAADHFHKETPLWEKLVKTQLYGREWEFANAETEEEADKFCTFQALIGRLLVPAGFDNWQVWLFLKGEANTGKGTVVDLVKSMFPAGSVASFDG